MGKHQEVSGTPSIVMLGFESESSLRAALTETAKSGIKCYAFIEPDIGNQMTAFATRPVTQEERSIFRKYKLL